VKQATEIYSPGFDEAFRSLPPGIRTQIEAKIHELGRHLETHAHHRLQGRPECRLRVADYRVFYTFDAGRNLLYLHEVGHRREIYR
jgi:mRNA-degrading endonuclease RelE of RelBE toxin-antitoxin system